MVTLPDEAFQQLKKDADDNRSVVEMGKTFVRGVVILLIFAVFMAAYGCRALSNRARVQEARTNVEIREIESDGLTFDEYIRWLESGGAR